MDTYIVSIRRREDDPSDEETLASLEINADSPEIAARNGMRCFLKEHPEYSVDDVDVDTSWES